MNEKISSENNESIEQLTEKVRARLIEEFKKSLRIYGADWIKKYEIMKLINDLEDKRPVNVFSMPFEGDHLVGVLLEMGIENSDKRYKEIRDNLEKSN